MARFEVRLYATLQQYGPHPPHSDAIAVQLADGATVGDLILELQLPVQEVNKVFVNYRAVEDGYILQEGDRVGIFPLVAGG